MLPCQKRRPRPNTMTGQLQPSVGMGRGGRRHGLPFFNSIRSARSAPRPGAPQPQQSLTTSCHTRAIRSYSGQLTTYRVYATIVTTLLNNKWKNRDMLSDVMKTAGQQTQIIPSIKCRVDDCERTANRKTYQLCEKHYYRLRRTGSVARPEVKHSYQRSDGYIVRYAPSHPLSDKQGKVFEHRMVFYDINGPAAMSCYWCKKRLEWSDTHIDHLNDVKFDNRPSNLVSSCPVCNQARGRDKMKQSMREKYGRMLVYKDMTMSCNRLAKHVGINRTTLMNRIDNMGMTVEQAVETSVGKTGPKRGRGG